MAVAVSDEALIDVLNEIHFGSDRRDNDVVTPQEHKMIRECGCPLVIFSIKTATTVRNYCLQWSFVKDQTMDGGTKLKFIHSRWFSLKQWILYQHNGGFNAGGLFPRSQSTYSNPENVVNHSAILSGEGSIFRYD